MNIHEHQAKEILKEFGAPVSEGIVIFDTSTLPFSLVLKREENLRN